MLNGRDIEGISCLMSQIVELARRGDRNDVKALAKVALETISDVQSNGQCVISYTHKEKLFDLLDAMKERVSDVDKFGIEPIIEKAF